MSALTQLYPQTSTTAQLGSAWTTLHPDELSLSQFLQKTLPAHLESPQLEATHSRAEAESCELQSGVRLGGCRGTARPPAGG